MRALKVILWIIGIGLLIEAVASVLGPWNTIRDLLTRIGITDIPDTAFVAYFFKIASGVFGMVGIFFIMLARNPVGYGGMLNLAAYGMIAFGLLAAIIGPWMGVPLTICLGDAIFGLLFGCVIAILAARVQHVAQAMDSKVVE
jgi:hypothetical protein